MITRNMHALSSIILQQVNSSFGMLPIIGMGGIVKYIHSNYNEPGSNYKGYPVSFTDSFTLNAVNAGISFGTGGTAATENDYCLESPITSGITVVQIAKASKVDPSDGCPAVTYTFSITNTGSETLTIREVCYKQTLVCSNGPERTNSGSMVCMLDRTVLEHPLVLAAGDSGILVYTLKTDPRPVKTKNGVQLVSWTWGSDEQIVAMIEAAHNGLIDLQADGGWHVGDIRKIQIGSFTGGNGTAVPEQPIDIMITSFDEYGDAGNVLQFDFVEGFSVRQRMNASNSTSGGYAASEMNTVTIPAIIAALPTWIKDNLLPFKLSCVAGGGSSVIETKTGFKLALRSADEVWPSISTGEGQYNVDYGHATMQDYRDEYSYQKFAGWNSQGGGNPDTWTRTPSSSSQFYGRQFVYNTMTGWNASNNAVCAPFGCL